MYVYVCVPMHVIYTLCVTWSCKSKLSIQIVYK